MNKRYRLVQGDCITEESRSHAIQPTYGTYGKGKRHYPGYWHRWDFQMSQPALYGVHQGRDEAGYNPLNSDSMYSYLSYGLPGVTLANRGHSNQDNHRAKMGYFHPCGMRCSNPGSKTPGRTCVCAPNKDHQTLSRNSNKSANGVHAYLWGGVQIRSLPVCLPQCKYKVFQQSFLLDPKNAPCNDIRGNKKHRVRRVPPLTAYSKKPSRKLRTSFLRRFAALVISKHKSIHGYKWFADRVLADPDRLDISVGI